MKRNIIVVVSLVLFVLCNDAYSQLGGPIGGSQPCETCSPTTAQYVADNAYYSIVTYVNGSYQNVSSLQPDTDYYIKISFVSVGCTTSDPYVCDGLVENPVGIYFTECQGCTMDGQTVSSSNTVGRDVTPKGIAYIPIHTLSGANFMSSLVFECKTYCSGEYSICTLTEGSTYTQKILP